MQCFAFLFVYGLLLTVVRPNQINQEIHSDAFKSKLWPTNRTVTWKLDHDHSLYDSKKIHQDIQQPFDDWARYTELPFRQVSEGEKTDFNLTFVSGDHSDGAPFDGLGGQEQDSIQALYGKKENPVTSLHPSRRARSITTKHPKATKTQRTTKEKKATKKKPKNNSTKGTSTIPTSSSTTPAKRALLLTDDAYADANNVLSNYMRASNVALTVIHGGIENYTGSPNASTFNVVIFFPIKWFGVDMPVSGQEAILNAQKAGTGIVLTEWASWRVHQQNQWHILAPLCLTYPKGYAFVPHITFTNLMQYHPIWNALPTTFTSVIPTSTSTNYIHGTGTKLAAKCEICGGSLLGVVVQDQSSEGKGRIVQINHGVNANGSLWDIDRNITQLMVNSVNWAAEFT